MGFIDRLQSGDLWQFEYAPQWIDQHDKTVGFSLSPSLPVQARLIIDGASKRPVQWFFDNLLPEEGTRTLISAEAKLNQADVFGLLAHYGTESAGALTLLPPDELPQVGGIQSLSKCALSERIRSLPQVSLSQDAPKRMSLAGAQHKLPVVIVMRT